MPGAEMLIRDVLPGVEAGHGQSVLSVRVACSGCPEDTEVVVESLDEVDLLFCDCDHGYIVLSVSEVESL